MSNDTDTVKVLNGLIRTSEDGANGFKEAAARAEDPALKTMFAERAGGCARAVDELQQLVRSLGGDPTDHGTAAAAAHRGWIKLKAAAGDNNLTVLEEVERGEDHAKAIYGKALKASLPTNVRELVERQYQGVLQNHDRIRDLRNQYKRAA